MGHSVHIFRFYQKLQHKSYSLNYLSSTDIGLKDGLENQSLRQRLNSFCFIILSNSNILKITYVWLFLLKMCLKIFWRLEIVLIHVNFFFYPLEDKTGLKPRITSLWWEIKYLYFETFFFIVLLNKNNSFLFLLWSVNIYN